LGNAENETLQLPVSPSPWSYLTSVFSAKKFPSSSLNGASSIVPIKRVPLFNIWTRE
jgi:hypothetical protein